MTAAVTHLIHGVRIRSAIPLDALVVDAPAPDMEIRWGERHGVPDGVPDGRLLARHASAAAQYSLTASPGGYLLRVPGFCEFAADHARGDVTVHLAPDADQGLASLLVGGFLAAMLALDGRCVLHASAIEAADGTVAFIGGSGMGKTTIAALCCAAGARLVTDDALRVEPRDGTGWCFQGTRTLRLRPAAAELAQLLAGSPARSTTDQRTAIRPTPTDQTLLPLAALIAPRCTRERAELQIERLHGTDAVLELLRHPRTLGWIDAEKIRNDLDALAKLAEAVPVYRAQLPWGPPFDPKLAPDLLARIGLGG